MSKTKPEEQDNFYDWLQANDAEQTRNYYTKCECGSEATYKGDKRVDTKYMHSYWCPKWIDKDKEK